MSKHKVDTSHSYEIDFESEPDFSIETSVHTDISLSPEDLTELGEQGPSDRKKKIGKLLLERKQLLRDNEVLKLQNSEWSMKFGTLKTDLTQRLEDLQEKSDDQVHQIKVLTAKLESQNLIQQEDAKGYKQKLQRDLEQVFQQLRHAESMNEQLKQKSVDIRESLEHLELTDDQYKELRNHEHKELSLKDDVAMKLYESVKPWKNENSDLKQRVKSLSDDLHRVKSKLDKTLEEMREEKRRTEDLAMKHQKLTLAYAEVKSQVQTGDYKIQNYDKLRMEHDASETDLTDLRKQHAYTEASLQTAERERDDLRSEVASAKHTIELLQKDKDYFQKQVSDTHNKLLYAEEKILQQNEEMTKVKQMREELYEKYVESRDKYKIEYEAKLNDKLHQIRVENTTELDRLRTQAKETYERENRNLRDSRERAEAEKDRAVATEKDTTEKYETLKQDFRHQQIAFDAKMSEMRSEVTGKSFDANRAQLVLDETVQKLKECQLENKKQQEKINITTKEYYSVQATLDRRTAELESAIAEKTVRLETYEKLERELDDVVMQAADVEDDAEAERVMFSYGYGANVPTTAKRRLKQSVHLARRVLQLERTNTSLRKDIEKLQAKNCQMREEVKTLDTWHKESQQPHQYLMESLKSRDIMIKNVKEQLAVMKEDYDKLQKDKVDLAKNYNQMAKDMAKLMDREEELKHFEQLVLNRSQRRNKPAPQKGPRVPKSPKAPLVITKKKSVSSNNPVMFHGLPHDDEEDISSRNPGLTEITAHHPADWHKRLQEKSQRYSTIQHH